MYLSRQVEVMLSSTPDTSAPPASLESVSWCPISVVFAKK